jgi:hypothetical protein
MKGKGELIIPRENVVDAIQQWLNQRWPEATPVVKGFYISSMTGADSHVVVTIESIPSFLGVQENQP